MSISIQNATPKTHRLRKTLPEALMREANLFQEFAKEAIQAASKAKSESERLALNELALTWVNAALASDRIFGSSFPAVH